MSRYTPESPDLPDDCVTFDTLHDEIRREMTRAERQIRRLETELATALGRLTDRQRRFCAACNGPPSWGKAYRAAEAAGYAWPRSQGPRLVTMPNVRKALDLALEIIVARWRLEHLREERDEYRQRCREIDLESAEADRRIDRMVAERSRA